MLLVLVGGVIQANATNVKRRFVVEFQDNIAGIYTDWKDNRYIYAWYYDGSDHELTGSYSSNPTLLWLGNPSSTSQVFCYNIEADEDVFEYQKINIILHTTNNEGSNNPNAWKKIQISDIDFSKGDYFVKIYNNSSSLAYKDAADVDYYIYEYDNGTKYKMTYSDGVLTYKYNSTAGTYAVIVPSYAIYQDNGEKFFWTLAFRPQQTDKNFEVNFQNYSDNASIIGALDNSSGKVWKFNITATIDVSLNLFNNNSYTFNPYFTRTLPSQGEGYGTFSSEYDVIPDATLTSVQYASGVTNGKISWADYATTGIKAGEGALLRGTAGASYKFTPATAAVAPTTNLLKANSTYGIINQSTVSGTTNYILTKVNNHVGFYKVNGTSGNKVAAGAAYLQVNNSDIPTTGSAPDFFPLDGDATAIGSVVREVITDNQYYTLDGRRVAEPTKGIYIVNGKKVIIK